ncbi:MAG: glycosyltransferase family 2 protein [Atopobiaceae bacterium]|nr:glycosyltransferase family 2 protein [Atopobiaceae bacterium]
MPRRIPKVSIIMPVYNVDSYLRRSIQSVQNQTLRDFEMIIVDDGSTDGSAAIADRAADRDIRIDVLHTPNQGAPAARNTALKRATGEYIFFMDADDWIEPQMLEELYKLCVDHKLQIAIAAFYIETYYGKSQRHLSEYKGCPSQIFRSQREFREAAWRLFDQNLLYTPWNKLFERAYLEHIEARFQATFWDDFPFNIDCIRDVERVGVTEQAYYHFIRAREESETSRWRDGVYEKREEEHTWMLDLYAHWGLENDPDSVEMIQRRYIERLVGCIENVCDSACELTRDEKLSRIETMICSERAQQAVALARPHSRMMKLMLAPIRSKNVKLAYREGKFISFVKRHSSHLFARLKASR